ncbi:MAG: hypothetical protein KDD22_08440 [Bdellovibrionales bacterium]|nr:hypothetical protein [Bdellovibrionales bacterium]
MKYLLILMATLCMSSATWAEPDSEVNCVSSDSSSRTYDLLKGVYMPKYNAGDYFCKRYTIRPTDRYSCNGNIRSFSLTCEDSKGHTRNFNCERGNCKSEDGKRSIEIRAHENDRLDYSSSEANTILEYVEACD